MLDAVIKKGGPKRSHKLTQRLYTRGRLMKRTDGGVGAKCEMLPATPETVAEVVRKLSRLKEWADHFGIETWAEEIIELIEEGGLTEQVTFPRT